MGEKVVLSGPSEARALGIGMVFQHFSLFENLTVAENVALGLAADRSRSPPFRRGLRKSRAVYGLPLDPKREVWRLSVGERQRIEIVRALMQNPKLLILDEPTAVLTPQEADQLFVVLERLKSEGRAILYISHKLEEVKRLCDTATILRARQEGRDLQSAAGNGGVAGAHDGRRRNRRGESGAPSAAATVPRLLIHNLSLEPDDPHGTRLKDVSLEVRGGEIVGIAGVAGNGQDELFAALSGERLCAERRHHRDRRQGRGPARRQRAPPHGRGFRPGRAARPRHRAAHEAVRECAAHRARGERHGASAASSTSSATLAHVDRTTKSFDVRKAKRDPEAVSLSGGNLQKFVVGREILREPGVLVVSQPTWGVDAGAAAVIRQALVDLAGRGSAVLVISQDLDELAEIADRIAVMFHGTLSAPLEAAQATREKARIADGRRRSRRARRRTRGQVCSWCLNAAPSARR